MVPPTEIESRYALQRLEFDKKVRPPVKLNLSDYFFKPRTHNSVHMINLDFKVRFACIYFLSQLISVSFTGLFDTFLILCIISPEIEFLADPVLVSVIAQCLSCFACLLKED